MVWTEGGIVYEPDLEHACKVNHDLGLIPSADGLDQPCVCETLREIEQEATQLDCQCHPISEEQKTNRPLARPNVGCWAKLKRLARYLGHFPWLIWQF